MKINGLDDQSLLLIFDRLSVESFLRAGRVCSRWNAIRRKAALSQKSLTLLIGEDSLNQLKESAIRKIPHYKLLTNKKKNHHTHLTLHDVNEVMSNTQSRIQINSVFSSYHVNFLTQLYANVRHFTISFPGSTQKAQLVNDLLVHWSAKLVTLKLYLYCEPEFSFNATNLDVWLQNRQLLTTINSIEPLRVVHYHTRSAQIPSVDVIEEDVTPMFGFVQRLTQFNFYTSYRPLLNYLIDNLNFHLKINQKLSNIGISTSLGTLRENYECVRIEPQLAHRYSQIATLIGSALTLEYLSNHFTNLTILYIDFTCFHNDTPLNPNVFYRSLASLKQLIYLRTDMYEETISKLLVVEPDNIYTLYGQNHMNRSMQVLRFGTSCSDLSNHNLFEQLCLYHFFPRLEVFIFERAVGSCDQCYSERLSYEHYCLKRMLAATGMHAHCEVIKTIEPNRKWSKEELTWDEDEDEDLVYSDGDEDEEEVVYEVDEVDDEDNNDEVEDVDIDELIGREEVYQEEDDNEE